MASPAYLPHIALLYEGLPATQTVAHAAPLPSIGMMFSTVTVTAPSGAPGKRRKRKMQLLEVDGETFVFDSKEEMERFIEDVVEPLKERQRAAKLPVSKTQHKVIRTTKPATALRAKPVSVGTLYDVNKLQEEFAQRLERAHAEWTRLLDQEDEELLWLL